MAPRNDVPLSDRGYGYRPPSLWEVFDEDHYRDTGEQIEHPAIRAGMSSGYSASVRDVDSEVQQVARRFRR